MAEPRKSPRPSDADLLGKLNQKPKSAAKPNLSAAKLEANRRNAQKSTGPRTPEGKAICRANALKHGYTGTGVVIHPEDRERLKTRLADWTQALDPRDAVEAWMVQRAALASVRVDRCATQEQFWLDQRIAAVCRGWYDQQHTMADDYASRLESQPRETLQILSSRGIGCEWLVDAWASLARSLQQRGHLDRVELGRLLNLLGESQPPQAGASEDLQRVWSAGLALLPDRDPANPNLPAPETARAHLARFLQAEVTRLEQRSARLWSEVDGPELSEARDSALFDPSDDGRRLAQYEKSNSAEVHRWLTALAKKRRDEAGSATENRAKPAATAAANGSCATNGTHAAPADQAPAFVMPRPLTERMGQALAGTRDAAFTSARPAGSENGPTPAAAAAASVPASLSSGQAAGGAALPAASLV